MILFGIFKNAVNYIFSCFDCVNCTTGVCTGNAKHRHNITAVKIIYKKQKVQRDLIKDLTLKLCSSFIRFIFYKNMRLIWSEMTKQPPNCSRLLKNRAL